MEYHSGETLPFSKTQMNTKGIMLNEICQRQKTLHDCELTSTWNIYKIQIHRNKIEQPGGRESESYRSKGTNWLGRINKTGDLLYRQGSAKLCALKIGQKQISALPSDEKAAMGRWRCSWLIFIQIYIEVFCYTPKLLGKRLHHASRCSCIVGSLNKSPRAILGLENYHMGPPGLRHLTKEALHQRV